MQLILASASPRRAELLRAAGFDFRVIAPDIDESVLAGESPEQYARRLAEAKACAVFAYATGQPVLAADTVVVADGAPLGKPADQVDAARMLRMLSGREHIVMTAVCLMTEGRPAKPATVIARTAVTFAPLSDAEIAWYVGSGEPSDKAGAYAVQGLASRFVTHIDGSYSNVVGLPIAAVYGLCKQARLLIC